MPTPDDTVETFDEPCAECGEHELYVDPDSRLCDVCSVIKSALEGGKLGD